MSKSRKKKRRSPPAAAPAVPPPVQPPEPDTRDRGERWMGVLCYLSILILIPACSSRRRAPFVRFHLNQGLVLLAMATLCGALAMVPGCAGIGTTLMLLVDLASLAGLVFALQSRMVPLPLVSAVTRHFHPF